MSRVPGADATARSRMSEASRMLPDPGRGLAAKRLAPLAGMDAAMRKCIDLCRECEAICIEAASHCLARGGRYAEPDFVNLLLTCAESCRTSVRFMLLRSEFHPTVCGINADVCEAGADDGEAKGTDEVLKRCVEACRRCAASCREMAGRPVSAWPPGRRPPRPVPVADPGTSRPTSGRVHP